MLFPILLCLGWIVQHLASFYVVRLIPNTRHRCLLTLVPCTVLTYLVGRDLPALHMTSMLFVTFCWLASIRFVHLAVLSPNQCSTFRSFTTKLLWMFFPVVPCTADYRQKWPVYYDFLSAAVKVTLNHWMYRWLLTCTASESYARIIMYATLALTYSFLSDAQSGIVRLVTRDAYMLQPITDFPLVSTSLREFWGRRYNRLIGGIFRESIFQPVLPYVSSKSLASLLVFLVSGLLHVHLAFVIFKNFQSTVPAMIFFLLHGIACSIEPYTSLRLPEPIPWLATQLFLLMTIHLQLGPFTSTGPSYYAANKPPLFEQNWIPKLPVPRYCPQ